MEKEYGQKAPTLPDGTMLLNEVPLSEEHTEQIKADRNVLRSMMNKSALTFIALILVSFLLNISGIGLMIMSFLNPALQHAFTFCLAGALVLTSWGIEKYAKKGGERLALRMVEVTKASKAASALLPLYVRYMPGEEGIQHYTYMRLLMDKDSELGNSEEYRVRLDTTNDSRFVVREIIVPKGA